MKLLSDRVVSESENSELLHFNSKKHLSILSSGSFSSLVHSSTLNLGGCSLTYTRKDLNIWAEMSWFSNLVIKVIGILYRWRKWKKCDNCYSFQPIEVEYSMISFRIILIGIHIRFLSIRQKTSSNIDMLMRKRLLSAALPSERDLGSLLFLGMSVICFWRFSGMFEK